MATGQRERAFAQKLNKQGAAEVRKTVSGVAQDLHKSASGLNLASGQVPHVPLCDVVEPLNFEDFVLDNQTAIERDPLRDLLQFPEDDIDVHLIPKRDRTVTQVCPENGADLDTHVYDCISRYSSDYTVVTRRYQLYSSSYCSKERLVSREKIAQQEYEIDVEDVAADPEKDYTKRHSAHINDTPRGSWASSIFDLKQSQADPILKNLFDRIPSEDVDRNNEMLRQQDRNDTIFSLYPQQDEEDILERRIPAQIPSEHFGHRILVKCLQLKLELEVEPIFASMALYDARERKKISETFHFDLNSENMKRMLSLHIPHQDVSSMSRSCVFSITYPSNDVFLVIKLEKVLQQGDITECADPYTKEDKAKEDKYRANAGQFCERLGKYRMPFAWTAIYLMNIVSGANSLERESSAEKTDLETSRTASLDRKYAAQAAQYESFKKRASRDDILSMRRGSSDRGRPGFDNRKSWSSDEYGSGLDNFKPITLTVSSFFKQEGDKLSDDDLYKFLVDLRRPSSVLKRLKCIPGMLKLDMSTCPDEPRYNLTPELHKVDPYPDDKGRPTKEILEFPSREVYVPYSTYRNLLFVYPQSLNFTNRQGSARNIAVKVQFMDGEEESLALPVIFGKSSCPELSREVYTAVTYHNKSPDFYEEIKIKMPARLTESHHLLFTFYHISCQNKKNEPTPIELPIGYTWLPILKDGRLTTGEFSLPVSLDKLPNRYSMLRPDVQLPHMRWVDNHKSVFTINLQTESSLHTQDDHLDQFLQMCRAAQEEKVPPRMSESRFEEALKRSVADIVKAKTESLVRFLPLILDKLVLLMVRPPFIGGQLANVGQTSFESMAQIVRTLHDLLEEKNDQHGRNRLLVAYIQYSCTLPHPGLIHQMTAPQLGSPTMQYNTLGRPASLPISKQPYPRSSSNPDLAGSTPTSPDAEVAGIVYSKQMDRASSMNRTEYAQSYSKMRAKKLVHEELTLQWLVSSGSIKELSLANSWFFFELIVKSMAEHLAKVDRLNAPRCMRFHDQFTQDLNSVIEMIIKDIVDRYNQDYSGLIRSLNNSLAFFLYDVLSLMDRGFVFEMIRLYCKMVADKITTLADATSLIILRLDFLRILCSHEHYFPLNLPFGTPLTPSAPSSPSPSVASTTSQISYTSTSTLTDKGIFSELSTQFREQHFLVGLVLSDLATAFDTYNPVIHHKAINVVRNLLYNHDLDSRYTNSDIKARLAALYLPLVGIVIDTLPQLYDPNIQNRTRNPAFIDEEGDKISSRVAMAIAGSTVLSGRSSDSPLDLHDSGSKTRKCMLNVEATRNLLVCFLWVVKNADRGVMRQWWANISMSKLSNLMEVIYFCVSNFEYKAKWALVNLEFVSLLSSSEETLEDWPDCATPVEVRRKSASLGKTHSIHEQLWGGIQKKSQDFFRGAVGRGHKDDSFLQGKKTMPQYSQQTLKKSVDMKSRLEEAILGSGNARTEMMLRRRQTTYGNVPGDRTPPMSGPDARLRWRKDQVQWKQAFEQYETARPRDSEVDSNTEGNLAAEVSMVNLDMLEIIIQIVQASDMMQMLLGAALRILLHTLGLNQSTVVLQNMFSTQRSLVSKFPELLFEEETEQCADLCLRLLRHCSSCISNTRSHASASLYLLMRQNFEIGNNFARVKMQVTMSLSSLVGQSHNFNEEYLRKSLKTILLYAEADVELQDTTFTEQVRDLVFNLHMILSDTVKMKEFQEDPEMLLDLMYRIAKGYQTSPDLRLTWLQNMAGKHSEKGNHAEAAHCLVHAAGLVSEYLNMLEDKTYLPVGCVAFQKISSNVLEESAVSDDVVSPDEEGICTGKYFTESGLVGLLEQTSSSFTMGGMYEAVNEVYKILIPIHEASRDIKKLAHIHSKLHDAFNSIIKQEGKRIFGTYFRVGFYGSKFGDLDGEEFVYKEPAITKLSEISHRLESFYVARYGEEAIQMIKDSNTVETDKLNPDKAYIQITYVEPYFDAYEFRYRLTYFDKNYNIKRFMYATPFTLDGRAHGDLSDQYKRKTIITTSHAFPYIKTRLQVVQREQIILGPVEVAIEDLQKKTKELATALYQEPPDRKMLQMVLQGCLGTTVNQGPLEMALVFLREVVDGSKTPSKYHNKLRLCFKDFLKKSKDCLHRNKTLINGDQKEYQRELERNYHNIAEKLAPMICSSTATMKRPKHHKSKESKNDNRRRQISPVKV